MNLPFTPWKRRWLAVLTGVLIALPYVPVALTEGSLRILPPFRKETSPAVAIRVSSQAGGAWRAVEIQAADGVTLRAWYFSPRTPNHAAVVLLHGVADTRNGEMGHVGYLLERGYSVLVPDSRGHGVSGGDLVTYGLRERDDVRRWADWLYREHPPRALYGLGHSLGAAILIQSLDCEPRFRAIVAESAFSTFRQIAYDRIGRYTGVPRPARRLFVPLVEPAFWYARWRYTIDFVRVSPAESLRRTRVPVLLIHGTADTETEPHHSRDLHAANPESTELWEVEGARHIHVFARAPAEYVQRVTGWFESHP
ncbi:MAG: alpha/beta hydrolase [Bryobacteraceae bacterium]